MLQGEERLERAIEQGAELARSLGRLPKMADWASARRADSALLSEWQVYRLLDVPRGAWTAFQYLVRERLREEGVDVAPDGSLSSASAQPDPRARFRSRRSLKRGASRPRRR